MALAPWEQGELQVMCGYRDKNREHRFLGFYRREINETPYFIYRCICGYMEAVPLGGGPHYPLDHEFRPRTDARSLATHLDLERGHELN